MSRSSISSRSDGRTSAEIITTIAALRSRLAQLRVDEADKLARSGKRFAIGLVPTMGALHEGHAALVKRSVESCLHTVVWIFVNPTQFGPHEDFNRYPRSFDADVELVNRLGADCVFHPEVSEIYPHGQEGLCIVQPPAQLIKGLCGAFRSGHFVGVATVVSKFFNMIQPDVAYFGEKDYQQLAVIKRMVRDLNFPVEIVNVETVREPDGLAMSSRNKLLSPEDRKNAPILNQVLCQVRDEVRGGKKSLAQALSEGRARIESIPNSQFQYLECCNADTLEPLSKLEAPCVLLVAAKLGAVRLIDNIIIDS